MGVANIGWAEPRNGDGFLQTVHLDLFRGDVL